MTYVKTTAKEHLRIFLLITGLGRGGAEKQVLMLAEEFIKNGHDVTLVSLLNNLGWPQSQSIRRVTICLNMSKSPWRIALNLIKLVKLIRQKRPQIIHSHMFHANIVARLIKPFVGQTKLVCTAHSANEGGILRMTLYRVTDFLCDITTNVSKHAVDCFVKLKAAPASRIVPILNGIDLQAMAFDPTIRRIARNNLGITDNNFVFLSIGRLEPEKDFSTAILAFSIALKREPDSLLIIAGEGSEQKKLEELAKTLDLKDSIRLLGFQSGVHGLLCAGDCLVVSSLWEGFSLVALEARAAGLPVVSTDCGGIRAVLPPSQRFAPLGSADRLADLMLYARHSSSRTRINQQIDMISFSIKAACENWERLYHSLIAQ